MAKGEGIPYVLPLNPLASTILMAWSMMFDMSTYGRCRSAKRTLPRTEARVTYADDVFRARLGGEHA